MKIALIPPIKYLDVVEFDDYHMVLPQLLNNKAYFACYAQAWGHKILDNGAAEGARVTIDELFRCAELINASEIVVPDVMGDCFQTIDRTRNFSRFARQHPEYKYIGVAQGKSKAEVIQCLTFMGLQNWIDVIALPRILVNTIGEWTRVRMIDKLQRPIKEHFEAVHCLGMGKFINEVQHLAQFPVRGIDTSLPFTMAYERKYLAEEYVSRQKGYFDLEFDLDQYILARTNIDTLRDWAHPTP